MEYLIIAKPYHYFMGAECDPTFKVELIKSHFSWKHFDYVNDVVLTVEERDWWEAIKKINKYICENHIYEYVNYPEWYRFLKPDN